MQADVLDLLRCYREATELSVDPPPSRRARFGLMTRLLTRLRPTWGLQRMVVEHIRGRIALIDRRFAQRLALGEHDANDAEDRAALSLFRDSLPPPRSRLWAALPLLAVIVVSQVLLALLLLRRNGDVATSADGTLLPQKVLRQLTEVVDLNPSHLTESLETMLHSSPKVTALAIGLLALSVYIVWRPLLPPFRLKRIILDLPGAISRRTARSELGARAQQLGVHAEELALFRALEMRPPPDAALDLGVKLILVAIFAAFAALMFAPPSAPGLGIFFLALAILRLAWLARERHRRSPSTAVGTPEAGGPQDRVE